MYCAKDKFLIIYVCIFVTVLIQGVSCGSRSMECTPGSYKQRIRGSCKSVPIDNDSCTAPHRKHAEYLHPYMVVSSKTKVPSNSNLTMMCYTNYKLIGNNEIRCQNKKWSANFGRCLKKCPSIQSTEQLQATCYYENRKLANCSDPIERTIVKYECSHFYNYLEHAVHICHDGSWSHPRPKCVPTCGRKFVDAQPLIRNGIKTQKHNYPWQVVIYKGVSKRFGCLGTLINQRVVLTSVFCVKSQRADAYTVAVGKYYRLFNDSRDSQDVQFSTLDELHVHPQFQWFGNMSADIAVLVTTKTFILSRKIYPICIDWYQNHKQESDSIAGWTHIKDKGPPLEEDPIDELQELKVAIITKENCFFEMSDDFIKMYLTADKFCSRFLVQGGVALDIEDAGSGLIVQYNDRYYLHGILSNCPQGSDGECTKYVLYTNISSYINFIWNIVEKVNITDSASKSTVLNSFSTSSSSKKLGSCPPIASTASTEVLCISNTNKLGNCLNPTDGTLALFRCEKFYKRIKIKESPYRICKNGSWNRELPTCSPMCGIKPVQVQTLIIGGENAKIESIPWQTAIYKLKTGNQWKLICGATMIHPKVFLTAAHCVTYENNYTSQSIDLFTVAVGKHYRGFNDSRDNYAQFSRLKTIIVYPDYQGYLQNYFGDIAVLITEKEFVLSTYIRPVCIDWSGSCIIRPFQNGTIAGWGLIEDGNPAEELKVLEVPYIKKELCRKKLDFDYHPYLTFDKMCSGYMNQNKSACQGDSGSGLVFKNKIDGKHYIKGIVSVGPQAPDGGCNSQQYTLYTNVSYYINNLIKAKIPSYNFN